MSDEHKQKITNKHSALGNGEKSRTHFFIFIKGGHTT